jgi:hypothetical protein
MIPADHWHDNGDGTAWLVFKFGTGLNGAAWEELDRPCDTCDGTMRVGCDEHDSWSCEPCPDCINGQHTFTVEVRCIECHERDLLGFTPTRNCSGIRTHRVSVAPGMVLPIHDECPDEDPIEHVCQAYRDERWILHLDWKKLKCQPSERQLTLPPAAAPGMWAAKVAVRS